MIRHPDSGVRPAAVPAPLPPAGDSDAARLAARRPGSRRRSPGVRPTVRRDDGGRTVRSDRPTGGVDPSDMRPPRGLRPGPAPSDPIIGSDDDPMISDHGPASPYSVPYVRYCLVPYGH